MKTIGLKSGEYEISLLSIEEYERYKSHIPLVNDWWWLRSPGLGSDNAACVDYSGYAFCCGLSVINGNHAVRPILKSEIINLPIGEPFIALGNRWVMIDNGFAISEDVITHRKFDPKLNIWEESELKNWLVLWAKDGET